MKDKNEKKNKETEVKGTGSLVCGILSTISFLMPYFGLPLGILAIAFSSNKGKSRSGRAVAGLVLGIIGVVLNSVMLLLLVMFFLLS